MITECVPRKRRVIGNRKKVLVDRKEAAEQALLSSIPTTEAGSADKERIILEGNIPSPVNPPAGCKFCTRCYMVQDKCRRVSPPLVEIEPGHFCACHIYDTPFEISEFEKQMAEMERKEAEEAAKRPNKKKKK